jgi:hypothetical protein
MRINRNKHKCISYGRRENILLVDSKINWMKFAPLSVCSVSINVAPFGIRQLSRYHDVIIN